MNTSGTQYKWYVIQKHTIVMYALFVLSCFHYYTLLAWLIVVPLFMMYNYKKEGAVEFLIFLQFRSLLSIGVAVPMSGIASLVKWAIVFLISLYLLDDGSLKEKTEIKTEIHSIFLSVGFFSFVIIIFSWITSSYPIVACFKVIAYCIPFMAIIKGVVVTSDTEWIKTINRLLGILIFGSVLLLFSSIGYLRNGYSFQGVFNHPNVYAVLIAIYVSGLLYEKNISNNTMLLVVICIFLLYQTKSRTGMISLLIVIVTFLLTQEMKIEQKIVLIVFGVTLFGLVFISSDSFSNTIQEYLYKGNSTKIFASREGQISYNIERFLGSPIIGTGFNVPYVKNYRSYSFSFDLVTENGNLFMTLLGDVGIVGTLLFLFTYIRIFIIGKKNVWTIFFVPFLVCMGEMAFFSTNNFAVVLYFFFAIYINDGLKR